MSARAGRILLSLLFMAIHERTAQGGSSVVLTKENFEKETKGKNVFIKWYDPKCDHCKKIAPEWEQMAAEWKDHKLVLIAEVDCRKNKDHEKWCFNELEIFGVPSLLYGEPSHGGEYLQSYGDDKTYKALTNFVNETLSEKPICSPGNINNCDKQTKKMLKSFWKLYIPDLEKEIKAKEDEIDAARKRFKNGSDSLQSMYDESSSSHERLTAGIKAKIKMIKSIRDYKKREGRV